MCDNLFLHNAGALFDCLCGMIASVLTPPVWLFHRSFQRLWEQDFYRTPWLLLQPWLPPPPPVSWRCVLRGRLPILIITFYRAHRWTCWDRPLVPFAPRMARFSSPLTDGKRNRTNQEEAHCEVRGLHPCDSKSQISWLASTGIPSLIRTVFVNVIHHGVEWGGTALQLMKTGRTRSERRLWLLKPLFRISALQ